MSLVLYAEGLLIFLCLIGIGLLSVCQASLVAASESRLRALVSGRGRKRTKQETEQEIEQEIALIQPSQSRHSLAALEVGVDLCILIASALTTHMVRVIYPDAKMAVGVVSLLMVVAILIFAEITPKSYGVQHAEMVVVRLSRFIALSVFLLRIPTYLLTRVSQLLLRLLRVGALKERPSLSKEEILALLEIGEEEGVLEEDEVDLAEGIFDLGKICVREIMVARPDIVALPATCSLQEVLDTIISTGHSRVPLYEVSMDNIVGIVYAYDILARFSEGQRDLSPSDVARLPLFVPETKKLDELLRELRARQVHISIVVDEHGVTTGLVTLEDIVEEIVGELRDEHDQEMERVRKVDGKTFILDGRLDKRSFEDSFGFSLLEGDYDTLGGFVFTQLGRLPQRGDRVESEAATFIVEEVKAKRITRVRMILKY